MTGRSVVRVVGPLAPYAAGFDRELRSRGYTTLSVAGQLRLMTHRQPVVGRRETYRGGVDAAARGGVLRGSPAGGV